MANRENMLGLLICFYKFFINIKIKVSNFISQMMLFTKLSDNQFLASIYESTVMSSHYNVIVSHNYILFSFATDLDQMTFVICKHDLTSLLCKVRRNKYFPLWLHVLLTLVQIHDNAPGCKHSLRSIILYNFHCKGRRSELKISFCETSFPQSCHVRFISDLLLRYSFCEHLFCFYNIYIQICV